MVGRILPPPSPLFLINNSYFKLISLEIHMPLMFLAPAVLATQLPVDPEGGGNEPTVAYDVYFPSTSALLHAGGTSGAVAMVDEKGSPWTFTGASLTALPAKFGSGGLSFSGSNSSYVNSVANTAFAVGTDDFTVECWIYLTDISRDQTIMDNRSAVGSTAMWWGVGSGGASLQFFDGPSNVVYTDPVNLAPSVWYHVAVSRKNGVVYQFVNGICLGAHPVTSNLGATSQPLRVGASQNTASNVGFSGTIDEFRFTLGVARYSSTVTLPGVMPVDSTDPYWDNVVFRMTLDGANGGTTFTDLKGHPITRNGTPVTSNAQLKFGTASGLWPTAGSTLNSLSTPGSTDFVFTGDFTIECWIYSTDLSIWDTYGGPGILALSSGGTAGTIQSYQLSMYPAGIIGFRTAGNNTGPGVTASSPILVNTWYHVAVVRKGSTMRLLLDGKVVATNYSAAGTIGNVAWPLHVGSQNYSDGQRPWRGHIDDIRITKGVARYVNPSLTLPAVTTNDVTDLQSAMGAAHLVTTGVNNADNNVFVDGSANNFTVTRVGTVAQGSYSPYVRKGWVGAFTPGAYIGVTNSAALAFGTSDFTWELWVDPTVSATEDQYLISLQTATSHVGLNLYNGTIRVGDFNASPLTVAIPGLLNTWIHLAAVRSGNVLTLFLNGKSVGTSVISGSLSFTCSGVCRIGAYYNAPSYGAYFGGYLSDVRLVKGTAVYTANFVPPTAPLTAVLGTSLLVLQDNRLVDRSGLNTVLSISGGVAMQPMSPLGIEGNWAAPKGGSLGFFSPTSYLEVPNHASLKMGTGDFTIECWVYPTLIAASLSRWILALGRNNVAGQLSLVTNTSGQLRVDVGAATVLTSPGAAPLNTWTHVVLMRSGGSMSLCLNGVQVAVATDTTDLTFSGTAQVGYDSTVGAGCEFVGYLADLRVTKGSAAYTAPFALPGSPLAQGGSSLLLQGLNASIYDNLGRQDLASINAKVSAAITKSGAGSVYLDGTAYLRATSNALHNSLGSGDFTISAWVYPTSAAVPFTIVDTRATTSSGLGLNFYINGTTLSVYSTTFLVTGGTVSTNVWSHVALTRVKGVLYLWLNGSIVGSAANTTNFTDSSLSIGATSNPVQNFAIGYLEDLSITQGISRSNVLGLQHDTSWSSVTPPTQAFGDFTSLDYFWDSVALQMSMEGPNGGTTFGDELGNTITPVNATTSTTTFKFGTASANLTGASADLAVTFTKPFTVGTGDFTVEGWVYNPSLGGYKEIFSCWNYGIGSWVPGQWEVRISPAGEVLFDLATGASAYNRVTSPAGSIVAAKWQHIAVSRVNGTVRVFVDGTQRIADAIPHAFGLTDVHHLGRAANVFLDDVRFTRAGRYLGSFRAPEVALSSRAALPSVDPYWKYVQLAMKMNGVDNGTVFTDEVGHTFTTSGLPVTKTAVKKFGTASAYFNGSSWVKTTSWADAQVGTGDFTLECWANPSTINAFNWLVGDSASNKMDLYLTPTKVGAYVGGLNYLSNYTFSTGTWYHIALVRKGTLLRIYVNGDMVVNTTNSSAIANSGIIIGAQFNNTVGFNGHLDDVRLTRGTARYLGAFIPRNSELLVSN